MADRLNLTMNQRMAFTAVVSSEYGVDLENVNISKSTAISAGKKIRSKTAMNIKQNFVSPILSNSLRQ